MRAETTESSVSPESARARQEFAAPGRVNLLGEHTDYTGGLVLPMAIPFTTIAAIAPRDDGQYRFCSDLFHEEMTMTREDRSASNGTWSDYPVGVLRELQKLGIEPAGFDLYLRGNVPLGAGLSSSASVEVASTVAMLTYAGKNLAGEEIALLSQRAENDYVHSPCGIMDQAAITLAKAGHALLLHTRTLKYEHLPMNTGALAATCVVVCNSMVKHSVATGEYGVRRREVEAGQAALCAAFPQVQDLGEATLEQLHSCAAAMSHESFLRCRHILSENKRVIEAKDAMLAGDAVRLGELITLAHASERDDFACSCEEVDFLVESAIQLPGCFGARLTGGGFGGCTVNLVAREQAESFAASLKSAYRDRYSIEAEAYVCEAVDGAMMRNVKREQTA